jgi:hypothetical protein
MRQEGWELLRDEPMEAGEQIFVPQLLNFGLANQVAGFGMLAQAFANGQKPHGQRHAEAFYAKRLELPKPTIPHFLLAFPGTMWRRPDGIEGIPVILYMAGQYHYYIRGITVRGFTSRTWYIMQSS